MTVPTGPTSSSGPAVADGTKPGAHEGPLSKLEDKLGGWFDKRTAPLEADAGKAVAGLQNLLADNATTGLSLASKIFTAAKLIDPADDALLTAFDDLIPEALALAEKGLTFVRGALHGNSSDAS